MKESFSYTNSFPLDFHFRGRNWKKCRVDSWKYLSKLFQSLYLWTRKETCLLLHSIAEHWLLNMWSISYERTISRISLFTQRMSAPNSEAAWKLSSKINGYFFAYVSKPEEQEREKKCNNLFVESSKIILFSDSKVLLIEMGNIFRNRKKSWKWTPVLFRDSYKIRFSANEKRFSVSCDGPKEIFALMSTYWNQTVFFCSSFYFPSSSSSSLLMCLEFGLQNDRET